MDDFLHNLRSGKLKQPDRANRNFDPQFKNKRNLMDRRKREFDSKESSERLTAIKEVLESVLDIQKHMAKAYDLRTKAEERKARALEVIAKSLYRMANPQAADVDDLFAKIEAIPIIEEVDRPGLVSDDFMSGQSAQVEEISEEADDDKTKPEGENRQELMELIQAMREDGAGWEKIARQISAQGYPTVSGRGNWRGVMVKNLYEKMTAE
jgi:hypothetical protein